MSKPADPTDTQPRITGVFGHNLSWIAMVVMAGMCLATLAYAAMLNIE